MGVVPSSSARHVWLRRVPTGLYSRYTLHVEAVERDARRALEEGMGPADRLQRAVELLEVFGRFRLPNRQAYTQALTAGSTTFDLELEVPPDLVDAVLPFLDAREDLDALARAGEAPVPAALADIVAFRRWLIGEVHGQLSGQEPVPYSEERTRALRPKPGD
jgi:hypothetical protein